MKYSEQQPKLSQVLRNLVIPKFAIVVKVWDKFSERDTQLKQRSDRRVLTS